MIKSNDKERCCGNCRFYHPEGRNCRRFPPQVWETEETGGSAFPRVEKNEWCGEHQFFPSAVAYVEVNYGRTEK